MGVFRDVICMGLSRKASDCGRLNVLLSLSNILILNTIHLRGFL